MFTRAFQVAQWVKNLPANAGDAGLIPGSDSSTGGRNGTPLQYFLPGKFHGQRSLVGYSPCGLKESDMTEHAHTIPGQTQAAYYIHFLY